MKQTENKEMVRPQCENHCPADQLRCPRGQAHFGTAAQEPEEQSLDDAVILLMRKCGHYLHHHGADASGEALLSALSEAGKNELIALLEKCMQNWQ